MDIEHAKKVIKDNLAAYERQSGYTHEVPMAVGVLHKEWFGAIPAMTCKECVLSAVYRVFTHYKNVYDTPTT
jgi:hypothetical protein